MENKERMITTLSGMTAEEAAFAIGRYSRSGKGIQEVLKELSDVKKASNFLQKFAVDYGHESLRDLATVTMALENISMLAAIELEHEQLWNGQERSTRYQDFGKGEYYTPDSFSDNDNFKEYISKLFKYYDEFNIRLNELAEINKGAPTSVAHAEMVKAKKAHIFDIIRILLPYCTLTSVGQIVSARTLQRQIARMYTYKVEEYNQIGLDMVEAASQKQSMTLQGAGDIQSSVLLKYTQPNRYRIAIEANVQEYLKPLFIELEKNDMGIWPNKTVSLGIDLPHKQEVIATLAYRYSHYSYNQIATGVRKYLTETEVSVIYNNILELRGQYDEVPPEFRTGYKYVFDILTDGKTMQDLYRHRRCQQFRQSVTNIHGFKPVVETFIDSGIASVSDFESQPMQELIREFDDLLGEAKPIYRNLERLGGKTNANYVLPMAYKRRSLFKMDAAEATYIIETRSQLQGHFSYRKISEEMYDIIRATEPDLANNIRLVPFSKGDFLKR